MSTVMGTVVGTQLTEQYSSEYSGGKIRDFCVKYKTVNISIGLHLFGQKSVGTTPK